MSPAGRLVAAAPTQITVSWPGSIFECGAPLGRAGYGSTDRCLEELCAIENVISTHILDAAGRLRRNPCYGRNPFEAQR